MLTPTNNAPASFPLGTTTVTYTATDAAGNTGTATQTVTVVDTTPPVITAPAAVTSTSSGGAINMNIGTATATDLFPVTVTNNAPTTFPIGITTVTWTATDANGNSATATQSITVNLVDTIPPVITVPADVFTSTYTSQASAVDNVDGIVAVTNNAPVTFPVGVTTVTYTASDAAGNTATATQRVIVSFVSTVGGGTGTGGGGMGGGTVAPPTPGGGATVGVEAIYWHHNDHLGTPQALTDINGTVVWTMSQTPFGIATVNEDPDGNGIKVTNNFRFPGQYFDAETGLNYNYQRTYDPAIGSYTQHDPIGLNGGMNTYTYALNNPLFWIDPFGLIWVTTNIDYHGLSNWGKNIIQYLGELIDNGQFVAPSTQSLAGSTRAVTQRWEHDPDNPCLDSQYSIGTLRKFNQTFMEHFRMPNDLVNDPNKPTYFQWTPYVPNRTYNQIPNADIIDRTQYIHNPRKP